MFSFLPIGWRGATLFVLALILTRPALARRAQDQNIAPLANGGSSENWLLMQPGDYGTGVLPISPDAVSSDLLVDRFQDPVERLAALRPLRLTFADGSGADTSLRPVSFDQESFDAGSAAVGNAVPSWQEELDNRQPLVAGSDVDGVLKNMTAMTSRLDESLGPGKTEEWAKRLQSIRDVLAAAQSKWNEARNYSAKAKTAPQEVAALQQASTPSLAPTKHTILSTTVAEVQAALDAAKQSLQQSKQDFEQHQAVINGRSQSKAELEAEVASTRILLDEFIPLPPPVDEDSDALAMQLEARAKLLVLRTQLLCSEEKLRYHDVSEELTRLKRSVAQLQVSEQQSLVQGLEGQVNELRRLEVQQQGMQAEREAASVDTHSRSLTVIAENNSRLVADRAELTRKIELTSVEKHRLSETLDQVKEKRRRLESKVSVAGMNHSVGVLMRDHRRELPDISETARRIRQIERELPKIQLTKIDCEDIRDQIFDVASVVQAKLREIAENDHVEITPQIETAVAELFNTQKQLIKDLIQDFDRYIDQLSQIDSLARDVIVETRTSQYFVDKHVLWIRSTEPLNRSDIGLTASALLAVSRSLQPEVASFDWRLARRQWSQFAVWAVLFLLIGVLTRKRLKHMLAVASDQVSRSSSRGLAVVCQMLVLILLVAVFWPAVCWGVAQYLCKDAFETGSTANSFGQALLSIFPFVALACVMWQLTTRHGFAEKYLAWPASGIGAIHRSIRWYLYAVLPLRCTGLFFDHFQGGDWAASAGRTMFILSQIMLFVCLNIAIRQASAAMLNMSQPRDRSFWLRTRRIWCTVIVLAPLVLACLSLIGYHYSASELSYRFGWTIWLILGSTAFVSLTQQIIQIVLQKISVRRFWLDRAMEPEHPTGEPVEDFDAEKVSHQIGRLLRGFTFAGAVLSMFLIWSQVLPAIQILDQVELWPIRIEVAENILGKDNAPQLNPDGTAMARSVTKIQMITLADLAWAAICLGLTVILSRNLPGLLEVTLLDRLPLDRGGKYAICVVCRYLVAIVGCVLAARWLGFEWSSVQWLVAAMSVGLGFGLQEIFGNFVSGMIILLERPIRVGDLVTVNGTTGCVTRIQLRATTITDADRREMIVPNKKFITDDVVNWTLTDPITRVVIPIGIAYGSNTELACATLLEVARKNEHVMKDPEPSVVFNRFGASSLDLELRIYIATREHYPDVQHELHMGIDRAFRERKIEIAFPQQDVHIRAPDAMAKALLQARQDLKQQSRNQNAA